MVNTYVGSSLAFGMEQIFFWNKRITATKTTITIYQHSIKAPKAELFQALLIQVDEKQTGSSRIWWQKPSLITSRTATVVFPKHYRISKENSTHWSRPNRSPPRPALPPSCWTREPRRRRLGPGLLHPVWGLRLGPRTSGWRRCFSGSRCGWGPEELWGGNPAGNGENNQRSVWWAELDLGIHQWPCAPVCWWLSSRLCVVSFMRPFGGCATTPEPGKREGGW